MAKLKTYIKKRAFFGKALFLFILAFLLLVAFSLPVFGEGSASMISSSGDNPYAYRPYSYWTSTNKLGIPNKQYIKVYANAGETLLFGSSVAKSNSIYVTTPSGNRSGYTPSSSGQKQGYIENIQMETTGPRYTDGGSSQNNGGYNPFQIAAVETGVYIFEFQNSGTSSGNPKPKRVNEGWEPHNAVVPAWDVTVVKGLGTGTSRVIKGRAFTNYHALITGEFFLSKTADWGKGLYSKVYVLTDDGYIYETDFNGLDPNGFTFFANSRGLINPENNSSLYHSARGTSDSIENLKVTLPSGKTISPILHLPNEPDTVLDKTHKIFFEMPADDLPESIRATPYMPGTITDFKFFGDKDNFGYVGQGGIFSFNVTSGSSYQIKIDFADNYGGTNRKANTLYLSNACVPGYNYIYWDGRDGNGDIVPKGVYGEGAESDGSIKIYIQVKAGEYHFPMLDAESNPFGTKIRLMNTPYNADGTLHVWDDPAAEEAARTTIYYDNSLIIQKGTTIPANKRNETVGGVRRGDIWDEIDEQLYALDGISSANGASRFMGTDYGAGKDATTHAGDWAFIDIWTYTVNDRTTVEGELCAFELANLTEPQVENALYKGTVFYDKDKNRNYNIQLGDYPLDGVTVELYTDSTLSTLVASTLTDMHGAYYFTGLTPGINYSVRVYSPHANDTFTTPTAGATVTTVGDSKVLTFGSGSLSKGVNTANDVGIFYETYAQTLRVTKKWDKTVAEDPTRPAEITVFAVGSYNGTVYIEAPAVLNKDNGWTYTFYNLPAKNAHGDNLMYKVREQGAEGYVTSLTFQTTEGGGVVLYTMQNAPREFTIVKQLDKNAFADEYFLFKVEGDTDGDSLPDIAFDIVLKVPAGANEARQAVSHVPAGTYTVTEMGDNFRYRLDALFSEAQKNHLKVSSVSGFSLTMELPEGDKGPFLFLFRNNLVNSMWITRDISVTNTMKPLN